MNIAATRREFLGGFAAFFAASFVERALADAREEGLRLKVGMLSDTHLRVTDDSQYLLKAFEDFKRRGVDVVSISGDVVEDGKIAEYDYFIKIWQMAFGDMPGKGSAPELFIAWGNHDYRSASKFRNKKFGSAEENEFMLYHKEEVWQKIFGEPFPGEIYTKKFKGVTFIGSHWGHENETGPWMKEHAAEIDTSSFFIYVQHPHPSGTVFMGTETGAKQVTKDMAAYPNCFAMSGHSHTNMADDSALWQGTFTSLGVGTVRGNGVRHGTGVPKYANGSFKPATAKPPYPHMKACWTGGKTSQAAILYLYENKAVIERVDYIYKMKLGADWVLPLPLKTNPETPFIFAAKAKGPEFPTGAAVSVEVREGENAMGEKEKQLYVKCPQAHPVEDYSRAVVNRFEVIDADNGAVLLTADALQPGHTLPIKPGLKYPAECVFGYSDIPAGKRIKVRVTALNAANVPGSPIESAAI